MATTTFHDCRFHDGQQWVPTWPWLQIRFTWVRISGVFGRFNDNRLGLGCWTLWRSTWQMLVVFWTMQIFFTCVRISGTSTDHSSDRSDDWVPFAPDSRVAWAPLDQTAKARNTSIRPDALAMAEGIGLFLFRTWSLMTTHMVTGSFEYLCWYSFRYDDVLPCDSLPSFLNLRSPRNLQNNTRLVGLWGCRPDPHSDA
jgi:hypothetical protein